MVVSIRILPATELDVADRIVRSAFGTSESRIADLRRYLALQPDGWFIADLQGRPSGIIGVTHYGCFAYLGMMTVRREVQRHGIGRTLLKYALNWIEERGRVPVLLDGTHVGTKLYIRFGFLELDQTILFQHRGLLHSPIPPNQIRSLDFKDIEALVYFDTPIFGANREAVFEILLADFPKRAFAVYDESRSMAGYLFAQSRRLGPWVARRPEYAEVLLQAALSLSFDGEAVVITPKMNVFAAEMLLSFGFEAKTSNNHMLRGDRSIPGQRALVYGQTSFAIG